MKELTTSFFRAGLVAFAVCVVLVFTPFRWITQFLAIAPENPVLFWILAAAFGSPFFGFLFLFLFSRRGTRLREAMRWAGIWLGAIAGSWTGMKIGGMT